MGLIRLGCLERRLTVTTGNSQLSFACTTGRPTDKPLYDTTCIWEPVHYCMMCGCAGLACTMG